MNTKPKAIKAPAKPTKTRKDAAIERIQVARYEAHEAIGIGMDMLYSLEPGTLTMTNALRLLSHINNTIMAYEKASEHLNEIE